MDKTATTPKKAATPKAAKATTRKAGSNKSAGNGQAQTGADLGRQDAASTSAPILMGGTKKVMIENMALPPKPYATRALKPDEYPFADLQPATKNEAGVISGPSFFIPETDTPAKRLATARKRYKCLFWSRRSQEKVNGKGPMVPGMRIWRGSASTETI
jgi:hypothetical protein